MLNENAKKWVAALRSGKYKQTSSYLRTSDGYCCLGVACEVARESGVQVELRRDGNRFLYDGQPGKLPRTVMNWLGLRQSEGECNRHNGSYTLLSAINDKGIPFDRIADIIESEPHNLFVEVGDARSPSPRD